MKEIQNVVLIGSGNVATHMGLAFKEAGIEVLQVFSRTAKNARELAGILHSGFTDRIDSLNPDADLYLIALSDDAIEPAAEKFPFSGKLLAHTSGTTPMSVLKKGSTRIAVFYPLQTFSKHVKLDYKKIPICLEVLHEEDGKSMERLACRISSNVAWTDSPKREMLHLAAVFACNFVNHMYVAASDILRKNQLPFDLLHPLIEETARKAQVNAPVDIQTGPARRNNLKVIGKHLDRLRENPDYYHMYDFISNSIRKIHGHIR